MDNDLPTVPATADVVMEGETVKPVITVNSEEVTEPSKSSENSHEFLAPDGAGDTPIVKDGNSSIPLERNDVQKPNDACHNNEETEEDRNERSATPSSEDEVETDDASVDVQADTEEEDAIISQRILLELFEKTNANSMEGLFESLVFSHQKLSYLDNKNDTCHRFMNKVLGDMKAFEGYIRNPSPGQEKNKYLPLFYMYMYARVIAFGLAERHSERYICFEQIGRNPSWLVRDLLTACATTLWQVIPPPQRGNLNDTSNKKEKTVTGEKQDVVEHTENINTVKATEESVQGDKDAYKDAVKSENPSSNKTSKVEEDQDDMLPEHLIACCRLLAQFNNLDHPDLHIDLKEFIDRVNAVFHNVNISCTDSLNCARCEDYSTPTIDQLGLFCAAISDEIDMLKVRDNIRRPCSPTRLSTNNTADSDPRTDDLTSDERGEPNLTGAYQNEDIRDVPQENEDNEGSKHFVKKCHLEGESMPDSGIKDSHEHANEKQVTKTKNTEINIKVDNNPSGSVILKDRNATEKKKTEHADTATSTEDILLETTIMEQFAPTHLDELWSIFLDFVNANPDYFDERLIVTGLHSVLGVHIHLYVPWKLLIEREEVTYRTIATNIEYEKTRLQRCIDYMAALCEGLSFPPETIRRLFEHVAYYTDDETFLERFVERVRRHVDNEMYSLDFAHEYEGTGEWTLGACVCGGTRDPAEDTGDDDSS